MSVSDRVDRLDMSLFDQIETGEASSGVLRSLLALHAALAARGDFSCLEVGSSSARCLQAFIADPRCRRVVSVNRREEPSADQRIQALDSSTATMLERLRGVPGADLDRLSMIDTSTGDFDPAEVNADVCIIHARHTRAAALRDARSCHQAIGDRGVIVFHDRTLVSRAIRQFLGELPRYRAYPLAHDLFVVEINLPSLLSDPRVKAQVPRRVWLVGDRLRAMRLVLALASVVSFSRRAFGRMVLACGAPHRSRRRPARSPPAARHAVFEIHTFVNDNALYERMRQSFIDAGFSPNAFVRLTDANDDPYAAITRIGRESPARYPILCHQDVLADQGVGAAELLAVLEQLDAIDPYWVVAGNAGVMRSGRVLRRLVDRGGGSTGESLPLPVVTLDSNFLVFNACNAPRCSAGVSEFHLYGSDVSLHALASGGSAYVVDFPVTHLGRGNTGSAAYQRAKGSFIDAWNERCWFRYVPATVETFFMSRSKIVRRLFGSATAVACVDRGRVVQSGLFRNC